MHVASKVGHLHSEFGHARPLGSRVVCSVRDELTDRQPDGWTDRSNAYCPFPKGITIQSGIVKRDSGCAVVKNTDGEMISNESDRCITLSPGISKLFESVLMEDCGYKN